ncbi:hypothetical protein CDES_04320 [Corynebacterium deserti GIMN1.010]|uniref:Uncharacterized protein n=1 Tax=Corynebacterium deserti GIMN1.010 TaxID=931089 RepID=A0A0M3Q9A6_9CORY|nr:hypothetical protein CDES_04320 [Corynebacterium deserti GIMN1.010]
MAIPTGVALLLVIIVAVASLMFTNTSMVNLPATIAQMWLSLNLGAVSGSGEVVSVLPTLAGFLFLWAIASRVHRAVKHRVSIVDLGVLTAVVVAIPLTLTVIACLMLFDASSVLNVDVPPWYLLLRTLLFHLSALFLGMGPRLWHALARRYGAPEWLIDAITQSFRFLIALATVSTIVALIVTAINHTTFTAALTGYDDTSATIALIVMSLLYLPNIVIFGMGMLVGAPLNFGEASISVFSVNLVPLPPLPILAALPSSAPSWAVALLLIPAVVATWVCVRHPMRLAVNAVAAVFAALFFLVLAVFAGGTLGVYNYVGLYLLPAVGMVFVYFFIVGMLIAGIDKLRNPPVVPAEVTEEVASEPVEEVVEEEAEEEEVVEEKPVEEVVEEEPVDEPETVVEETNDGSKPEDR